MGGILQAAVKNLKEEQLRYYAFGNLADSTSVDAEMYKRLPVPLQTVHTACLIPCPTSH
jgi:hypothetical protein